MLGIEALLRRHPLVVGFAGFALLALSGVDCGKSVSGVGDTIQEGVRSAVTADAMDMTSRALDTEKEGLLRNINSSMQTVAAQSETETWLSGQIQDAHATLTALAP